MPFGFADFVNAARQRLSGLMSMQQQDRILKLRGTFHVDLWRGPPFTGSWVATPVHDENLVVTVSRKLMSRLLAGCPPTSLISTNGPTLDVTAHPEYLFISQMRWGSGGHDPLNPQNPAPGQPNLTDESLATPLALPLYKGVAIDFPLDTSVRFTATLDQTEANGVVISEEGLFAVGTTGHPLMFARKCFGMLSKTSDFSFSFSHQILF